MNYQKLFNVNISATFKQAFKLFAEYPKTAAAILTTSSHETKAKKLRQSWHERGVSVPPLLIIGTTDECNLRCKECYAENTCRGRQDGLPLNRVKEILNEAGAAGCSTILLAGGEPLLSPDWLYSTAEHAELLGLVFTNGTLFDENWYNFFESHRNMIALFSVEGLPERTDERRGPGVSETIKSVMERMRNLKIPFGISVTTGSHNIDEVTSDGFTGPFIELGCRIVVYVEYVPVGTSSDFLPLPKEEKLRLAAYCNDKAKNNKAIFVSFPGNEDESGGCLAAGRGFLYITASGSLEPCPFAPFSDRNLASTPFIKALRSPLLEAIRNESHSLREGVGGCSLRGREDWVKNIIAQKSAVSAG
jgi:MoaA/NifB/PqqE/SkfB family radical SAM enzyme